MERRKVSTVEELNSLERGSVIASFNWQGNIPVVATFQRGTIEKFIGGWSMPDTEGEISSFDVLYFLQINELNTELEVLYDAAEKFNQVALLEARKNGANKEKLELLDDLADTLQMTADNVRRNNISKDPLAEVKAATYDEVIQLVITEKEEFQQ